MSEASTSVLVAGGGLAGLSSAVFLAARGVPVVVVERHPGSSPHPRAIGFTPRTLELFATVGLSERIPQAPPGLRLRRTKVESLAGRWFDETPWTPHGPPPVALERSPCSGAAIAQDKLEPILRERAIELGADVRLATELVHFEQNADGVVAVLRDAQGRESTLHADSLIGADGHRSPVREALGIGRTGFGPIRTGRSVLFRAPLQHYLEKGFAQFSIEQPGFEAFLTTYGDGRWVLFFSDDVERDDATLRAQVERAIGRSDLPIELIVTGRWEISALIADRFAEGRVFLAGDAAHTLPPNRGGFGANTGIEDAHNLAWKLASVRAGTSKPSLLHTYDSERRPIAWLRHDQIFARPDFAALLKGGAKDTPIFDDAAMEFGQLYRSASVLGAGSELLPARPPEQWQGQPGTRAPHLPCSNPSGEVRSTLDFFGQGWVLLAASEGWEAAAAQVSAKLGIALAGVRVGIELRAPDLNAVREAFGLGPGGASLIRPDGYVAWRCATRPGDAKGALGQALGQVAAAVRSAD